MEIWEVLVFIGVLSAPVGVLWGVLGFLVLAKHILGRLLAPHEEKRCQ